MKKYISEFIGTFMLVFLGTGAVVVAKADTLTIGLAFGMAITIMAYTFGGISGGNFNPAVSIAMMINGRLSRKDGVLYIIAQFLGSIVASAFIWVLVYALGLNYGSFGQTDFPVVTAPVALLVETVITFIFVLVILMVTSKKYGNDTMAPLAIGITLAFLIIVALNVTGGSLNPARSFGPAIFAQDSSLSNYWVYLIGPIVGAILAAFVAKYMGSEEGAVPVAVKPVVAPAKAAAAKPATAKKKTTTTKKVAPKKTATTKKATTTKKK